MKGAPAPSGPGLLPGSGLCVSACCGPFSVLSSVRPARSTKDRPAGVSHRTHVPTGEHPEDTQWRGVGTSMTGCGVGRGAPPARQAGAQSRGPGLGKARREGCGQPDGRPRTRRTWPAELFKARSQRPDPTLNPQAPKKALGAPGDGGWRTAAGNQARPCQPLSPNARCLPPKVKVSVPEGGARVPPGAMGQVCGHPRAPHVSRGHPLTVGSGRTRSMARLQDRVR